MWVIKRAYARTMQYEFVKRHETILEIHFVSEALLEERLRINRSLNQKAY